MSSDDVSKKLEEALKNLGNPATLKSVKSPSVKEEPDWEKKLALLKAQMVSPQLEQQKSVAAPELIIWASFFMSFLALFIALLAYFK